ncbi:MarR family winged helix-turn-helix transcriptional regulator [Actinoallomurus rhizosphaericola]|uniref:MarR family winged helix-turn-helix transcriptional regulator n=1 Tax=Actinoallomurus rhizosphaericola TaxID=2952536 RepID=UPI002092FED8|nr:MarR family transcriptional regulator [Actinoallomurus rhizosphaericola]MCO5998136.1 MarR family transcriptional regulator [Actinoallomurus rhizosphaericola]
MDADPRADRADADCLDGVRTDAGSTGAGRTGADRANGERAGAGREHAGEGSGAVAGRLRVALVALNRRMRKDWPEHLTPSRLSALTTIAADGPLPVGELARRMAVSTPTVSHIVDALAKLELIDRRPDPRDRRVCRLVLSDAGDELLDDLGRRTTGFLEEEIRRLPAEQRAGLAAALPALEALAAAPERPHDGGMDR